MSQSNGQELQVKPPTLPRMESVERISKLPVVEQTVDLATNLYGKVKVSNTIVNSVLTTAETTVKGAVDKTIPVTTRLEGPIKQIDTMLCTGLDYVENKIPAVKLKPDEIVKSTKDYVSTIPGVKCACEYGEQGVKRAVECACAVSQFGAQKLTEIKDCLVSAGNPATLTKTDDTKNIIGVYLLSTFTFLFSLISSWFGVNIVIDETNNIKTVKREPSRNLIALKERIPTKEKIIVNGTATTTTNSTGGGNNKNKDGVVRNNIGEAEEENEIQTNHNQE